MLQNNQDISCGFDMDDDDDDALLASCSMDVTNTQKRRKPINVSSSAKVTRLYIALSSAKHWKISLGVCSSPVVAYLTSDHWVAGSNPLRGMFPALAWPSLA